MESLHLYIDSFLLPLAWDPLLLHFMVSLLSDKLHLQSYNHIYNSSALLLFEFLLVKISDCVFERYKVYLW